MEQIPMIIDGKTCGQLSLRREGAYMVCSGRARWQGDMLRLWLYGDGGKGYLGVLIPEGNGMASVRKRFSLGDFARLPKPIAYCAPEEQGTAVQGTESEADVLWVRRADGTLISLQGERRYMAFPAEGVRLPRGGAFLLRRIEGQDYVIFPC